MYTVKPKTKEELLKIINDTIAVINKSLLIYYIIVIKIKL